ncbi:MAG: hypothetical protein PF795_05735 [Kiritimatiellae bacterium]|jgi:hypothetical protein|nr:hypothetical protein [Kiritimatiellia bacterium]
MKTTLILKDDLVRKAKSKAALHGWTLSHYMERCLERSFEQPEPESVGDWLDRLPKVPSKAHHEVNAIVEDADYQKVDPEMWS